MGTSLREGKKNYAFSLCGGTARGVAVMRSEGLLAWHDGHVTAQGDDMGTERDEILTTAQAAAILKVPESTLKRWRSRSCSCEDA